MTPAAVEASRSRGHGASARKSRYRKLKPGPGHSPEEVLANQRVRLQGAMVELVSERGYDGVTVRGLTSMAGVSTRAFYAHFENTGECFASTYELVMQCALYQASAPAESGRDWEENARARLLSLMRELADHPKAGHFALVDPFAAGPAMLKRMETAVGGFERLLTDSLAQAPDPTAIPLRVVQGAAAGATRVARARLLAGQSAELPGIADELGDWMLALRDLNVVNLRAPGRAALAAIERKPSAIALGEIGDERARILAATLKIAARKGYRELTIPRIRAEASVSRRSFDAQFAGVQDCFLRAVEALMATAAQKAERELVEASSWERGVYRAIFALCAEVAGNPQLAQLGFADVLAPGLKGLHCREGLISLAADRLRELAPPRRRPGELATEASVAAAWRIAEAEVAAGRAAELPKLAPTIAYMVLAPAVGAANAVEAIRAEQAQAREPRSRHRSRLEPVG